MNSGQSMKNIKILSVCFVSLFLCLVVTISSSSAINLPSPVGTSLDFLKMEVDAIGNVTQRTTENLTENILNQFENIYAIIDNDYGPIDFNDPNALLNYVDEMYNHPVLNSRIGLATALRKITDANDVGKAIISLGQIGDKFYSIRKDLPKAAQELSALLKGAKRTTILKNCLLYGTGHRAGKLKAMLDAIDEDKYLKFLTCFIFL